MPENNFQSRKPGTQQRELLPILTVFPFNSRRPQRDRETVAKTKVAQSLKSTKKTAAGIRAAAQIPSVPSAAGSERRHDPPDLSGVVHHAAAESGTRLSAGGSESGPRPAHGRMSSARNRPRSPASRPAPAPSRRRSYKSASRPPSAVFPHPHTPQSAGKAQKTKPLSLYRQRKQLEFADFLLHLHHFNHLATWM